MFDSHLDDLIENRVMNDETSSNKITSSTSSSPSLKGLQQSQISKRGFKDLINHPPSKTGTGGESPISNSSSASSTPPQLGSITNRRLSTTTANAAIKFSSRKDQSLKEVLEDWRTDFYPNLSYDHYNENALKLNLHNNNLNNSNNNGKINEDDEDNDEDNSSTDDDDSDNNDSDLANGSENEDQELKNNNSTYNEYMNNIHKMKGKQQKEEEEEEYKESLLEQRVNQWKNDIFNDITQSSDLFMDQLPQRVFDKPPSVSINTNIRDENLPMTPSTRLPSKNEDNNSDTSVGGGKSQFEFWRDDFNKDMDEKMKEKKRTNKIMITSNK